MKTITLAAPANHLAASARRSAGTRTVSEENLFAAIKRLCRNKRVIESGGSFGVRHHPAAGDGAKRG